jgi:hypothetical protein
MLKNIKNGKIWYKYHRKMEKYGVFKLLRVFLGVFRMFLRKNAIYSYIIRKIKGIKRRIYVIYYSKMIALDV